jgi:nicotinamidase/pyrazinamidase
VEIEELNLISTVQVSKSDALIIVDLQNDFMPGGALPVEGGNEIVSPINQLAERFHTLANIIVMTQDWHPRNHRSFARIHDMKPYDRFQAEGIGPVLWPDHCIQGTEGAAFHPHLKSEYAKAIIRKGFNPFIDSYSAFIENDKKTNTGLSGYLSAQGISRIIICGLTLDYCVYYTAMDGRDLQFQVIVVVDLTKPVNSPPNHLSQALTDMTEHHIQFINSQNMLL